MMLKTKEGTTQVNSTGHRHSLTYTVVIAVHVHRSVARPFLLEGHSTRTSARHHPGPTSSSRVQGRRGRMLLLRISAHRHRCGSLRLVVWRWQSPVSSRRYSTPRPNSVHSHVTGTPAAVHHHPVLVLVRTWATHAMHRPTARLSLLLRIALELLLLLRIPHVMHVGHSVAVEVPTRIAAGTHSAWAHASAHHSHAAWTTTTTTWAHAVGRRWSSHSGGHRVLPLPAGARSHRSRRHLVRLVRMRRRASGPHATAHRPAAEHHAGTSATAVAATRRSAIVVAIVFR